MKRRKKNFKISLISLLSLLVILVVIYFLGPTPATPKLNAKLPEVPQNLDALEKDIKQRELTQKNLKPDNQARIIWNSSTKEKTPYSIVYLHGFSASQAEGDPVHLSFAKKFACNLYLARLDGHGIDTNDALMNVTPESLLKSAKRAVAIGKQIGDKVIIMATSTGASLALYIAAENPEIEALILYSPLVDFHQSYFYLLDKPWGLQIARLAVGSKYRIRPNESKKFAQYWINKFRLEGVVALKSLISETMQEQTFKKIKQPVFIGYYYRNESEQDQTISIKAAQEMFKTLGTAPELKREKAFPKASHHVIASYLTSKDVEGVLAATIDFAEEILEMKPVF